MKECPWCHNKVELQKASIKALGKAVGNWVIGGKKEFLSNVLYFYGDVYKAIKNSEPDNRIKNATGIELECPTCGKFTYECSYCHKLHKWETSNVFHCSCGARF